MRAESGTVTVSDPLTHVTTYKFNIASQRLTDVIDANNHTTSAQYDFNGRLTRVTKPEGNYTQVTYDARGNVTESRMVAKAGLGPRRYRRRDQLDRPDTNAQSNEPEAPPIPRRRVSTVTRPAPAVGAVRPQTRYSSISLRPISKIRWGTSSPGRTGNEAHRRLGLPNALELHGRCRRNQDDHRLRSANHRRRQQFAARLNRPR